MALTERAGLKPGETVLVNGSTGTSGRLAVQIARHLGAGRIIATGRNVCALRDVEALGADVTIQLDADTRKHEMKFLQAFREGVDIVIDYLWGPSAEDLLMAAARAGREAFPPALRPRSVQFLLRKSRYPARFCGPQRRKSWAAAMAVSPCNA